MDAFVYFSELLNRSVVDKDGRGVGALHDLVVKTDQVLPQVCTLIIKSGFLSPSFTSLPWEDVAVMAETVIRIKKEAGELVFSRSFEDPGKLTLRRDVLDQQVVDTYNHKVVRVNDIHLLFVGECALVAHVDLSGRGLLRRLGFEKTADFLVRLFSPRAHYLSARHLVSWKYIHPLALNPASMTIKIDASQKQLADMHGADLADIFLDLPLVQKTVFFRSIEATAQAKIFMNLDFKTQRTVAEDLDDNELASLLQHIPADEATDFLENYPEKRVERLLTLVSGNTSRRLSQLLGYASDSAGGLMTSDYLAVSGDTPLTKVIELIRERKHRLELVQYVYIVDHEQHLIGATNFRRILLADPRQEIARVQLPKSYFVHLTSSVKEVAYLMEKYKYNAIPVVDDNQVLQGIITVDDILEQLIALAWRRIKHVKVVPKQKPPAGTG